MYDEESHRQCSGASPKEIMWATNGRYPGPLELRSYSHTVPKMPDIELEDLILGPAGFQSYLQFSYFSLLD
jgi:hypothetical protein